MVSLNRLEYHGNTLYLVRSDGKRYPGYSDGNGGFRFAPVSLSDKPDDPTPPPTTPPDSGGGNGKDWQWPFQYSRYVIQNYPLAQYGMRKNPVTGLYTMHWGLDFGAGGIAGQPVPAAAAGTVTNASYNGAMGNHVVIEHPGGFRTRYFHFVRIPDVKTGQVVTKGQKLGNVGSTGNSTGPHLHWETYENNVAANPRDFMKRRGVPEN
jgi:murein DD-endopeptidase MepM/ murein hydrolase activator NlpD